MPVPKKRAGSVDLRNRVSDLLGVPLSTVFITGTKRMELRIWTENMDESEVLRLRNMKDEVKKLAAMFNVARTSLSNLHPRDAQKLEDERRQARDSNHQGTIAMDQKSGDRMQSQIDYTK